MNVERHVKFPFEFLALKDVAFTAVYDFTVELSANNSLSVSRTIGIVVDTSSTSRE